MRCTIRRTMATISVLALPAALTACSGNEASETDKDADAVTEIRTSEVTADSIVGLEVTAVGNVSEILSDHALRLDRDGVGSAEEQVDATEQAEDEAFGDDDVADEGVLVVSDSELQSSVEDEVRVSGTIRSFDQDIIESVYNLDLGDDSYDEYENSLVIVAESVQPASAAPADGGATPSESPSPTSAES